MGHGQRGQRGQREQAWGAARRGCWLVRVLQRESTVWDFLQRDEEEEEEEEARGINYRACP